ncbi:hypothetical protein RINTHM_8620 [Richelia intracellularis HM01]|nr:hypothetical protein RINTHM_8620 [Richelia intracellularis HM01]
MIDTFWKYFQTEYQITVPIRNNKARPTKVICNRWMIGFIS